MKQENHNNIVLDSPRGLFRQCAVFAAVAVCCVFLSLLVSLLGVNQANAAQTVPYKVNFQGRLTDASGNIKTDGQYNMKIRLFSAASSGTALWTEVRGETSNKVQVTNGLFSIQLGDVTTLSPSLFTNQPLYLEVELPTPATATCSTNGCASYSEGAMTPRSPLGSSPYAFNSDTVDGIDGSSLARKDAPNVFSESNTFNSSTQFNDQASVKYGSSLQFNSNSVGGTSYLQQAGGATYFNQNGNGLEIGVSAVGSAGSAISDSLPLLTLRSNGGGYMAVTDSGIVNPDNLLSNPGFEFGSAGWQFANVVTNGSARTGNSNLEPFLPNKTSSSFNYSRPIAVQPNEKYFVSGYVKSSSANSGTGGFDALFFNASGGVSGLVNVDQTNPGTSYSLKSNTVTVPANSVAMQIRAVVNGDGTQVGVWDFDDISARRADQNYSPIFKNAADSSAAFTIQNSNSVDLFVADTSKNAIKIGGGDQNGNANPTMLVLDYKNSSGDPSASGVVAGSMYYNSSSSKFRCFEGTVWKDCITELSGGVSYNGRDAFVYKNDMFTNASTEVMSTSVSGGTFTNQQGEPNHPGLVRMFMGTTAAGRTGQYSSGTSMAFGDGSVWTMTLGVRINALSDNTNTYTFRAGFTDSVSGDAADGCYFRYTNGVNAGNYQGVCRSGNSETSCDTGLAAVAGNWMNLKIGVNGAGSAAQFVNNDLSLCTVSSNIPTGSNVTGPGLGLVKTAGTANTKSVDIDYMDYRSESIGR